MLKKNRIYVSLLNKTIKSYWNMHVLIRVTPVLRSTAAGHSIKYLLKCCWKKEHHSAMEWWFLIFDTVPHASPIGRQRQVEWGQTAWGGAASADSEAGGDAGLSSGWHGVWEAQVSFKEPPAFRDGNMGCNPLDCRVACVTISFKNVFCASCVCSLICEDTAIQLLSTWSQ